MNLKAVRGRGASLCGLIVVSESKHDTFHRGLFALPTEGCLILSSDVTDLYKIIYWFKEHNILYPK